MTIKFKQKIFAAMLRIRTIEETIAEKYSEENEMPYPSFSWPRGCSGGVCSNLKKR